MTRIDTPISYMTQLLEATTIESVWRLHARRMEDYGFTRLLFGMNTYPDTGFLDDVNEALILSYGDQEYTDICLEENLFLDLPMIEWAKNHRGAVSWADAIARIDPNSLSPTQMRLFEVNMQFGVMAGYNISLADVNTNRMAVIGLCARKGMTQSEVDALWIEEGAEIEALNNIFYFRVSAMPRSEYYRPLTRRQKEALRWYGEGKTTQEIAIILGLSPTTVEKHFRGAREALGAGTTVNAVKKALRLNLI